MFALLPLLIPAVAAQYTATYTWGQLPDKSEGDGQTGTNNCGTKASQTSMCQNVVVNSANDFCLWGPPGTDSSKNAIGQIEEIVVAYCLNDGYGTRLLPPGTITNAHFVKVVSDQVSYVQVTGDGDFTKINIPAGDEGGELDPHSWTGLGNPQGGLVFTNAFTGAYEQTHEWMSFQSASTYCIRACRDGPNAAGWCQHIYDVLGCWAIPGSFESGFDTCEAAVIEAPGVYGGSTFYQGDASTPAAHAPGATSKCTSYSTVGGATITGNALPSQTGPTASGSVLASVSGSASLSMSGSPSASASASASMSGSASGSASGPSRQSSMSSPSATASSRSPSASAAPAGQSSAAADKRAVAGLSVFGGVLAALFV